MKRVCCVLWFVLMLSPALIFAQSEGNSSAAKAARGDGQQSGETAGPNEAQKAFDQLKTLAGSWAGQLTTFPAEPDVNGKFVQFSLRVTSLGNALVHEMSVSGLPDHPVTMFYLDGDRLTLTHYCDAGNRPRMVGKLSPDRKTLEFDFFDLSGSNQKGHMHHAALTFVDENRHTEEWTYAMPDGNSGRAHFELQRTNFGNGSSGK